MVTEETKTTGDSKQIDWEQRRYEIAKDVLCAMTQAHIKSSTYTFQDGSKIELMPPASAVREADMLIYELQKEINK